MLFFRLNTSTVHVPPFAMSGGEIVRTFIRRKLEKTMYNEILSDFESPPNKTSVTERFLDGNFIVTCEKE